MLIHSEGTSGPPFTKVHGGYRLPLKGHPDKEIQQNSCQTAACSQAMSHIKGTLKERIGLESRKPADRQASCCLYSGCGMNPSPTWRKVSQLASLMSRKEVSCRDSAGMAPF